MCLVICLLDHGKSESSRIEIISICLLSDHVEWSFCSSIWSGRGVVTQLVNTEAMNTLIRDLRTPAKSFPARLHPVYGLPNYQLFGLENPAPIFRSSFNGELIDIKTWDQICRLVFDPKLEGVFSDMASVAGKKSAETMFFDEVLRMVNGYGWTLRNRSDAETSKR